MVNVNIEFQPESVNVHVTNVTEETTVTVKPIRAEGVVNGVTCTVTVAPEAPAAG